jgi:hypothetical protein
MADNGKLSYTEILNGMATLASQVSRLHTFEAALKAAQQGDPSR